MASNEFDVAVVTAGANTYYFGDDQQPPFHAYGHFLRWVPYSNCENAALLIEPGCKPVLFWHTPQDYWYAPSQAPEFAHPHFEILLFDEVEQLNAELEKSAKRHSNTLQIGPVVTAESGSTTGEVAKQTLRQLDYYRAFKTSFEVECMKEATAKAVLGHIAARRAFLEDASELEIHQHYLSASQQSESALPYPNIVGMNEHAATLHYQHYESLKPDLHRSLLIDAGATFNCYHSDITRTHTPDTVSSFYSLISALNEAQQSHIATIKPGGSYLDGHISMSHRISKILEEFNIVSCSAESAFEQQLTDVFFPHGVGHLLGLQTHDVGGHIVNEDGDAVEPHERFDSLRLLRTIEKDMVFTIEPGIYFIPMLLQKVRNHRDVNWQVVEQLLPYGGIRIEDNVLVTQDGVHNLTREAFDEAAEHVGVSDHAT